MLYNRHKTVRPVSFKDVPCLVNKQFKYKTLGEMVAMYKRTGEFPAVGMRNGVYFATGIDDPNAPVIPEDKIHAAEIQRNLMQQMESAESDLAKANQMEADEKAAKAAADKAELEALRASKQNPEQE